jgi:hypothetical protein
MSSGSPHKQLAEIGGREYAAIDGGSSRLPADALRIELTGLLEEFVSGVDVEYAVETLVAALDHALFHRLREEEGWPLERLEAGWRKLVEAWISLEG